MQAQPKSPGVLEPRLHPHPTAGPAPLRAGDTSVTSVTSLRTPPCFPALLPLLFHNPAPSGAFLHRGPQRRAGKKWIKSKFLSPSEELCAADGSGFVCSSPVSEELPNFQRERARFGCRGFALCQPSFRAAGFSIPALLCFQMPIKVPPPSFKGGFFHTTKIRQHGRNPAFAGLWVCNSPAAMRCLQNVEETLQGKRKKKNK